MVHILLVDDQLDARQMLRAGLESLGPDVRVTDVPSGEEAYLVFTHQPIDLLIADMRLAGMDGLELMVNLRKKRPELRVVMVTGMSDPQVREQVAKSKADAVFFKPVILADFLETVQSLLGIAARPTPTGVPAGASPMAPTVDLEGSLAKLRKHLGAVSLVLLDCAGRVLVHAGELPDNHLEAELHLAGNTLLNTSQQVSLLLENQAPRAIISIPGETFELYCAHTGERGSIVAITNQQIDDSARLAIMYKLWSAADDLVALSAAEGWGGEGQAPVKQSPIPAPQEFEVDESEEDVDTELELILEQAQQGTLKPEEVEDFWQSLANHEDQGQGLDAGSISYDQARRQGLLPEDDEL